MGFLVLIDFLIYIIVTLFLSSLIFPTPFSDTGTVRYRTIPWMTFALILVNSMAFIIFQAPDLYQGAEECNFFDLSGCERINNYIATVYNFGLRGSYLRDGGASIGAFTSFTSMFMHGDMWHVLGNMIYLWTFGRRVEDACGGGRFLLYYLAAGMVANIGSLILDPSQMDTPGIGASGAIAGVMGAYLLLFPGARVTAFWGIGSLVRVPVMVASKLLGEMSTAARWIVGGILGAVLGLLFGSLGVSIVTLEIFQDSGLDFIINNTGMVIAVGVVVGALVIGYAMSQSQEKNAPIWRWTVRIPAGAFLIFFIAREFVPSINVIQGTQELVGVNNLAHVAGFLAAIVIFFYVRKDLLTRYFAGRSV
jgi:membrane associated rhomboid family serine protease